MTPDDHELMARVKAGDDGAFAVLFERHYRRVLNIVYRYLGSESEAEDLAQEAFLRVYRAAPRFQPQAAFTTWLYQIVANLCLNLKRTRGRAKLRYVTGQGGLGGDAVDIAPDGSAPEAGAGLVAEEDVARIRACLAGLIPTQRMALVLMHYEGLGYDEIGATLGVTPGAAKALCHRAREALREKLERERNP